MDKIMGRSPCKRTKQDEIHRSRHSTQYRTAGAKRASLVVSNHLQGGEYPGMILSHMFDKILQNEIWTKVNINHYCSRCLKRDATTCFYAPCSESNVIIS